MRYYFECKYKFGEVKSDSKEDAEKKIKGGAWCESRCNKCKLRITEKK